MAVTIHMVAHAYLLTYIFPSVILVVYNVDRPGTIPYIQLHHRICKASANCVYCVCKFLLCVYVLLWYCSYLGPAFCQILGHIFYGIRCAVTDGFHKRALAI